MTMLSLELSEQEEDVLDAIVARGQATSRVSAVLYALQELCRATTLHDASVTR